MQKDNPPPRSLANKPAEETKRAFEETEKAIKEGRFSNEPPADRFRRMKQEAEEET